MSKSLPQSNPLESRFSACGLAVAAVDAVVRRVPRLVRLRLVRRGRLRLRLVRLRLRLVRRARLALLRLEEVSQALGQALVRFDMTCITV